MTTLAIKDDYHGKFTISELYRDAIIAPIIERQGLEIDPSDILVLLDEVSDDARLCAQCRLMPEMISDVIYQLTGVRYRIIMRLSQSYMTMLEPPRIAYYVYDALRHIQRNDDDEYIYVRDHDVCVWQEVLPYAAKLAETPDVSEVKIYDLGSGGTKMGESADASADNA